MKIAIDEHRFEIYTMQKYTQGVMQMKVLPIIDPGFKNLIPPLSTEEREQLEQNIITARKCHDAIILWEGIIVDGHNRYEICKKHGIEFEVKEIELPSKEAAMVWILENQLARRNLTDAMRIEVALLKEDVLREKAKKNQSRGGGDRMSSLAIDQPLNDTNSFSEALRTKTTSPKDDNLNVREALAADANVSKGTLNSYLEVKQHASPELLAQVKSGKVKIGTARRMLTKEVLKQLNRADKMYKFIEDTLLASEKNENAFEREGPLTIDTLHASLINLSDQLRKLICKLKEAPNVPA